MAMIYCYPCDNFIDTDHNVVVEWNGDLVCAECHDQLEEDFARRYEAEQKLTALSLEQER